jgi:hypothetical protein
MSNRQISSANLRFHRTTRTPTPESTQRSHLCCLLLTERTISAITTTTQERFFITFRLREEQTSYQNKRCIHRDAVMMLLSGEAALAEEKLRQSQQGSPIPS